MATIGLDQLIETIVSKEFVSESKIESYKEQLGDEFNVKKLLYHLVEDNLLTKWQARQLFSGESLLKIGDYTILNVLGTNRFGEIYLVKHKSLKRAATLQILPESLTENQSLLQETIKRWKSLSEITHPNLVRIIDINKADDKHVLLMERVQGFTLARRVRTDGPMDKVKVAKIVQQIAQVLESIHISDTKHLEVCPGSIVIDEKGKTRLLPFDESTEMENRDYFYKRTDEPDAFADDLHGLGRTGLYLLTGKFPTFEQISGVKSPLLDVLRQMTFDHPEQMDSATNVDERLGEWIATKVDPAAA